MVDTHPGDGPVVVGVDGSHAALNAVRWAAAEAQARDVCLRLVHAVPSARGGSDAMLAEAHDAAAAVTRAPRVQTVVTVGAPGDVLGRESSEAAMVCIGARPVSSGTPLFGVTARYLAERARCPVAIIRTRTDGSAQTDGVVSVVLTDDDDTDALVHLAMHEGRLRGATVRLIDQRTDSWVRRYPDVHVELAAAGTGRQYCRHDAGAAGLGLAVVGARDVRELADIQVPASHPILGYPDCSVLLRRS
ncbi:universal stress protein UspA [Mycolicibacterium duvalii]|uniref:Universal stress protein n=1 Tax=Mycolicibacterium duvalii TaxID=39688 RepID=A0A7I7K2X9_9MYCO|nr:universal stress protein [Mycolicibacterium duvalii]MCV7367913.1 universal stress protein [Mycolicibacterium duvalii]PEG42592.1 universal stress protein UspA [Mycolicibacterium duvalii]BBX18496.1 universal stress protein [Mycolicibacterium duvalii]